MYLITNPVAQIHLDNEVHDFNVTAKGKIQLHTPSPFEAIRAVIAIQQRNEKGQTNER